MRRSLALPLALASLLASPAARAAPYFSDATAQSLLTQPCGPGDDTGCYTNFAVIADLDGDGAPDVLFANGGGYYTAADAQPAAVYLNDGKGGLTDVSKASFGGPSSRLRQIAVGDVDGDGDLDVYMPGAYGVDLDRLFVQTAPRKFVDQAAARLPKGLKSRAGAAHFGDVDDDGDLDLVVTDWGASPLDSPGDVRLYLNDGKGRFSAAPGGSLPAPLMAQEGNTPIDVDLQDVNGDGHLDILVDHRNGQSRLFLNDGTGHFTDASFPPKQGPYVYNTEACDIDGDGDLDLLLDNAAGDLGDGHRTQILVNDGTGHFTDESTARVAGEPNTDDNAVKCADIDNDGDFDLIVASLANPSEKLLLNDGTGHFTAVMGAFPDENDPTLGLDVADLDGDGVLDVVTGQGEGSPWLNRVYRGQGPAQADTRPPVLRQVLIPDEVVAGQSTVIKLAVSDAHTSEVGQEVASVSVAYEAGATKGTAVARFVGGDLFRATIPPLPEGSLVTFTPGAVDLLGHSMTGLPATRTVAQGAGGAGGQAGSGGSPAGGAAGDSGAAGEGGPGGSGGSGGLAGGAAGSGGDSPAGSGGSAQAGNGGASPAGSGGSGQAGSGGQGEAGSGPAGSTGAGGAAGGAGGATGGTGGLSGHGGTAGTAGQAGGVAGSTAGGAGSGATEAAGDTGDEGGCSTAGPVRPARGGSFALAGLLALVVGWGRRGAKATWGMRRGAGKRG